MLTLQSVVAGFIEFRYNNLKRLNRDTRFYNGNVTIFQDYFTFGVCCLLFGAGWLVLVWWLLFDYIKCSIVDATFDSR